MLYYPITFLDLIYPFFIGLVILVLLSPTKDSKRDFSFNLG